MNPPEGAMPFDLEKAKAGHPLIRRDGGRQRFIAHIPEAKENSRLVTLSDGGSIHAQREDGRIYTTSDHELDLFLAPPPMKEVTLWVNVHITNQGNYYVGGPYYSEEAAQEFCSDQVIATAVPITFKVPA